MDPDGRNDTWDIWALVTEMVPLCLLREYRVRTVTCSVLFTYLLHMSVHTPQMNPQSIF